MAIDHFGRTTEVQINAMRPHLSEAGCVLSQAHRVGTQQLGAHRYTRRCESAVRQLGHHAQKSFLRQQSVGNADELGHAAVYTAHPGQHVAQYKVQQPLHGGEQYRHKKNLRRSTGSLM